MTGIFISYRREDSAGYARSLYDRLHEAFGADHVFMDVAGIEPGMDFEVEIDTAISACDSVLVLISRQWLDAAGPQGRRLDDPKDFVRLEVAAAVRREREVWVVPVLVGGAAMPNAEQLSDDLKPLARRQASTLTDEHWDSDVNDLIRKLKKRLPRAIPSDGPISPRLVPWLISLLIALAAASGVEGWRWYAAKVVVPSVVGQTLAEAHAMLRRGNLELGSQQPRRVSGEARGGVILEQNPGAGARAKAGSAVAVVVAQLARPSVPNVVGMPLASASAAMREAGLHLEKKATAPDANAVPDTVLNQSVPAGQEVDPGTRIAVVVAVVLPPAVSLQFTPPTLDFGSRRVNTSSVESVVISNPGGSSPTIREVQPSARVGDFSFAAGSCAGNTLVQGEQCTVDVYFVPRSAGKHETTLTVIDANGKVHAGTHIVGEGSNYSEPGTIDVPRLLRLSYDQAFFALSQAGLAVGNVSLRGSANVPSGMVLQQLTAPGSKVPPRTAIDFVVSVQAINVAVRTPNPPVVVRGGATMPAPGATAPEIGPATLPLILHFVYDPRGARLCYGVARATRVRIQPSVGSVRASVKECVDVKDGAAPSYTLSASNDAGQTVNRTILAQ